MTPNELAAELSIDPKALRRWLRATWPPAIKHSRWDLTDQQIQEARARFGSLARNQYPGITAAATTSATAARVTPSAVSRGDGWSAWVPLLEALTTASTSPGVYMARRGEGGPVVYVGMAGERRGAGVRGRLAIYVSGKGLASGLGEAVFDRALADEGWLSQRLDEARRGEPLRAKLWGRAAIEWADLHVRWQATPDRASALALELAVLRGLPQEHLWNRRR